MTGPDTLIVVVGVFVTLMAVWASVSYGVLVVQRWELTQDEESARANDPRTAAGGREGTTP